MFFVQNEPYHTYAHPSTKLYIRITFYVGRAATNIQHSELKANSKILRVIRSHLDSKTEDICI